MGIRGLATALRGLPVGAQVTLCGKSVVIDGPALVHRICESLMEDQRTANVILEQVTYAQLSQAVTQWLEDLRGQDVHVRKIYFDGYLPPFKWGTRKERLIRQTATVRALQTSFRHGVRPDTKSRSPRKGRVPGRAEPEQPGAITASGVDLRSCNSSSLKFSRTAHVQDLPKPPFMIPAVIESLRAHHEWRDVLQVVPGEADAFCAHDIKQNGGLLLTSDSDLLIQDLGPDGSVVFLWDLRDRLALDPNQDSKEDTKFSTAESAKAHFTATSYCRLDMERHFALEGLGGLPRLVFEWQRGNDSLAKTHMRLTSDADIPFDEEAFNKFFEEHRPEDYIPEAHPIVHKLSSLDPRISEFIIQSLNIRLTKDSSKSQEHERSDRGPRGHEELSIFLPTMVEDTSSKSSWEYSQITRQLAYGLTQSFSGGGHKSVIEYRALQSTKGGRKVDIPKAKTVDQWCEMLVSTLTELGTFPTIPNGKWLAFACYQEIQASEPEAMNSASVKLATEAVHNKRPSATNYSWQLIQLNAIIQASFYSLRILKQVLELKESLAPEQMTDGQKQLLQHLSSLPPISEWPSVQELYGNMRMVGRANGFATIAHILRIPDIRLQSPRADMEKVLSKKVQKTKKRSRTEGGNPASKVAKSSNPFEALGLAPE